jgi:phage shock protein PspC (stress-responsive transcriptional regulator)
MVGGRGLRDDGGMKDTNLTPADEPQPEASTPEEQPTVADPESVDEMPAADLPIEDDPFEDLPFEDDPISDIPVSDAPDQPRELVATPAQSGRWTRPRENRILAGVAVAIAQHTELPLWFVRASFVITGIAGGFGVAAYLAAWALMPAEGDAEAAADRWKVRFDEADSPSKKLGLGLIAAGIVVAVGATGILSSPLALAALLVIAGIALTRPSTSSSG